MLRYPVFQPHYHVEIVPGDGAVLLSEKGATILHGPLYESILPWIDGHRSAEEIAAQIKDHPSAAQVSEVLSELERGGHLTESDMSVPQAEAAFWSIRGISPQRGARRLAETGIALRSFGGVAVEPFAEILRSLRVRIGEEEPWSVVLTDDYLRSGLEAFNREALRDGRPWMLVKSVGNEIWIGPVFRPGCTACWECLAQRLRANREVETFLQERKGREPLALYHGSTLAAQQAAWNLAAIAATKWIASEEACELEGRILTFDLLSWKTEIHTLIWRPQCPACSDPPDRPQQSAHPVELAIRRKFFTQDGGHRTVHPQVTIERYEHHVSRITGAVHRLERFDRGRGVFHVYDASHNAALRQPDLKSLQNGLRSHSGGKGASDVQARASGLCEALERYSAVFRGDEPRRKARFRDLGDAAVHPNACMLFSDTQYRTRETCKARSPRFGSVPIPFDEEREIEWSPVWSLTHRTERFLPTSFCYFRYPAAHPAFCIACSNGNAAGNTLEEAILQGFLELIERDSVALWWYTRVSRPAVDLDSFDEPYLRQVATSLKDRGRDLWILDLTTDLGIPSFAALSRRTDQRPEHILFGFGAHLDVRIAILRAVTELHQFLARITYLGREDGAASNPYEYTETVQWLLSATLDNQPYLQPDPDMPVRSASAFPRIWTDDLREDIWLCQGRVEEQGLEVLVLDQTRPDIGLPVVKVIVPGLRHFWPRYGAGRLYEVPVQLGWLPQPLAEEQLNPLPMFV
jgi:bacteriocin biosynthesis cyclodehydratase domain-containing protein